MKEKNAWLTQHRPKGTNASTTRRRSFAHDIKFAKEFELAWLLRWCLSRITRVSEGTQELIHGLLEWEAYEEWRGRERCKLRLHATKQIDMLMLICSSCQLSTGRFPLSLRSDSFPGIQRHSTSLFASISIRGSLPPIWSDTSYPRLLIRIITFPYPMLRSSALCPYHICQSSKCDGTLTTLLHSIYILRIF